MVLGKQAILKSIGSGKIRIDPFSVDNLREASYIFTLSRKILILDESGAYSEEQIGENGWILQSGTFVVGYTVENLTLGENISALLSTRRAYARLGIDALQSDAFAEPYTDNVLELSIRNGGPSSISLFAGMPLVKAFFQEVCD